MNYYTEDQVKTLLSHQRHNCQIERDKRSFHNNDGWFVHCDDVMNAEEPPLPLPESQQHHQTIVVGWCKGKVHYCRTFNDVTDRDNMLAAYSYVSKNCDAYVMTELLDTVLTPDNI